MKIIVIEDDVPADAATVFTFLTDFDQLRRWRSLESMRTEPAGPLQVGTRLFSVVRGPGGQMTFTNEVTDLDPERRFYRDRFLTGAFPIQSSWQVEPTSEGARIVWHTEYAGGGIMRLLGPFLGRAIRQGQLQDLAKLRQLLQER
jgi:uncharacterized protein YndB with AHSA1/START domain